MNRSLLVLVSIAGLAAALAFQAGPARGADEPWKPSEPGPWAVDWKLGGLISESAFSNNWAKGDKGTFSWVLNTELNADRQFSKTFNWSNYARVAYGQTGQQVADPDHPGRNVWESPSKTTDQILAESTGRFTLGAFVDPFIGVRAESQFEDESSPFGTLQFNPVRLTESAGMARVFHKTEFAETVSRLGFGARQTFGKEFINEGESIRRFSTNDGGIEWLTTVDEPLTKSRNLEYNGRLLVFAPLFYSQSGALDEFDAAAIAADPGREEVGNFWQVPDVDFQNEFVAKVTKLINVNLLVHMIYDKYDANTNVSGEADLDKQVPLVDGAIRKGAQWRQTLAIGLTYQIF
ncbi:MAG: hypothetical protein FD129_552 [bacterium]|nr:MAG: hypothetical protein FD129_552 [bacterium]